MNGKKAKTKILSGLLLAAWSLTAQAQPVISSQPTNQTVLLGSSATFSVNVSTPGPTTYLWQFNGSNVPNQIITVAGNGSNSYSGDNGLATSAALNTPSGLCIDSNGNMYIADSGNNRIRKVATNGIITTIAGNGTAGYGGDGGAAISAELNSPAGVAIDSLGRLYISDSLNSRIRRVNTNNVISTFAGNGTAGYSGDNGAATNAELSNPFGLSLDIYGNLYLADSRNQRIREVTTGGIITTIAGDGVIPTNPGSGDVPPAELYLPSGVSVTGYPFVFVADTANERIARMTLPDGTLTEIAGTGVPGFSGDGGAATNAQLYAPDDVLATGLDSFYIADSGNHRLRQVSNGIISTIAGNGIGGFAGDGSVATDASLYKPECICLDSNGNLFIADSYNNRIREVSGFATGPTLALGAVAMSEAGSYTVIVSNSTGSVTSSVAVLNILTAPSIAVQPVNQSLLVASNLILSVTAAGTAPLAYNWFFNQSNVLQTGASSNFTINGVGTNNAGAYSVIITNAYGSTTSQVATVTVGVAPSIGTPPVEELAWAHSNALFSVTAAGNGPFAYQWQFDGSNLFEDIIETIAEAGLSEPQGVSVDAAGNVYIADSLNYRVAKLSTNGVITTLAGGSQHTDTGDGGLAADASLSGPTAVALDPFGNVYIAEPTRVRKIGVNGIINTVAGTSTPGFSGDGGLAINAQLSLASAVACDAVGNLFVADAGNNRIREVSGNGIITTIAGNGTAGYVGDFMYATNAELYDPDGVAVDMAGNVYISDSRNYRIRRVAPNGSIATIAGTGTEGLTGDGGLATAAELTGPAGLAIDPAGNLYMADRANRIRKVGTNGIITTVAGTSYGYSGDGGAATNAQLNNPTAVAFDTVGNLYIADTDNNRVREVFFAGQPTLALTNVSAANVGDYSVTISSALGSMASSNVFLELITHPVMGAITVQSNGSVALNFTGTPNAPHCLWMTTNLLPPVVWSAIATNTTSTTGAGQLIDTNVAGAPTRFYRISLP